MKEIKNSVQYAYWCTWQAQNYLAEKAERKKMVTQQFDGAQGARAMLNEETVFGNNGFISLWGEMRKELYLMLDDGWDVAYGLNPDKRRDAFGSLELNKERFPFSKGSPADRLKLLNERVKYFGWKGVGIWVAAQCSGKNYLSAFSKQNEEYWKERILWSKYAGVVYWKVDWGTWEHDILFRKFLSETAAKLYPDLIIEHAICCPPLNGVGDNIPERLRGRFTGDSEIFAFAKTVVSFSEIFRTYDVLSPFSVATTLDRVASLLPIARGYLNVEDELYLAAALGLQIGIMRSHYGKALDVWDDSDRLEEVNAVLRWQRIAPPFWGGKTFLSEEILYDDYKFGDNEVWYPLANGNLIVQGAPCVVSRNTPLPKVKEGARGIKPYVVASFSPSGVYALAVLPRTVAGKRFFAGGEIICDISNKPKLIAIFGKFDLLKILWKDGMVKSVMVQSMLGGKSMKIVVYKNSIEVEGAILRDIWQTNDKSASAILLHIEYD